MKGKIKILRLIARLNNGGPAKHVIWLTEGLDREKFESILVTGMVEGNEDPLVDYARLHDVNPLYMPKISRSISPFKDVVAILKIIRLIFKFKPDIIHTHTSKAGFLGRTAGLIYKFFHKAYIVHTFHGHTFHSYFHPLKGNIFLSIERFLAKYATDKIIVLSKEQFEEINSRFRVGRKEQFEIIPLGINLNEIMGDKKETTFKKEFNINGYKTIGIIGRIAPVKNHKMFIDVASNVLKRGFKGKTRFVIVGGGSQKDIADLKNYAKDKDIEDYVIFAGNRYDTLNFYSGIDVIALTSLNEGTPLSLIEGMSAGKPFVSTDVGGISDLMVGNVEERSSGKIRVYKNGILVNLKDVNSFAESLLMLLEDEGLRLEMGMNGHEFVISRHSKERLIRDMENLYLSLY